MHVPKTEEEPRRTEENRGGTEEEPRRTEENRGTPKGQAFRCRSGFSEICGQKQLCSPARARFRQNRRTSGFWQKFGCCRNHCAGKTPEAWPRPPVRQYSFGLCRSFLTTVCLLFSQAIAAFCLACCIICLVWALCSTSLILVFHSLSSPPELFLLP